VAACDQIEATVHDIHKVETAIEPRFQEHFVNASAIPERGRSVPPTSVTDRSACPTSVSTPAAAGGEGAAQAAAAR
jgi:uncharacterized 2Fe-2S/4Fe-4S cluster protein (DUF4445 family)